MNIFKYTNSSGSITWSRPDMGLVLSLVVVTSGWLVLTLFDWIFGYGTGPEDHSILRNLIALLLLSPLFVRWFRPTRAPSDNQQAFQLHKATGQAMLVMTGLVTLFAASLALFDSTNGAGGPDNLFFFLTTRWTGLAMLVGGSLVIENLMVLFDYNSRSPRSAVDGMRYGIVFSIISAGLIPGDTGLIIGSVIGFFTAFLTLILSLRSGWVVHIKRAQKYRMLGLSFLSIVAAVGLSLLLNSDKVESLLASMSPTILMLGTMVTMLILITESGLFFRVLLTLPTAGAMDRRNTEVSSLSSFGRLMVDSFDMNSLMEASVAIACDVTSGRSAWIELFENDRREVIAGGRREIDIESIEHILNLNTSENERSLGETAREERSIRIFNIKLHKYRQEHPTKSITDLPPFGSLAIVPLSNGEQHCGVLYVLKPFKNGFDRDDVSILSAVANQIGLAMEHSTLIQRSIERERLRNEMLIAREAQQRLLPASMPSSDAFEVHAESEPASMVGGDYYDAVKFSNGMSGLLIADVSGKGAGAALYMGMVKGIIRALSGSCETPAEMLTKVNASLHKNIDPRFFVTMTCVKLLEEERAMQIVRAGHCPTLVISKNGKARYHTPRGIGLALTSSKHFEQILEQETLHCDSGDLVILFSDGLAEARSVDGEELGFGRFLKIVEEVVKKAPDASLNVLRDDIFEGISTFTQGAPPIDDSTLVMIRWR